MTNQSQQQSKQSAGVQAAMHLASQVSELTRLMGVGLNELSTDSTASFSLEH